ncbi:heterokaryon incompatibility protein-domain-containing protein [Cercophora scortea]|uniref:Heterokaryon incompatibility protein-domain-containing protein n=1 Tax=Cercophora scortea TaxID=314031 RepID=A0AAE0IG65_9PEZI|nr:heterokaryon incompatibility protein-domain-containing protein [Cercophora scortea]
MNLYSPLKLLTSGSIRVLSLKRPQPAPESTTSAHQDSKSPKNDNETPDLDSCASKPVCCEMSIIPLSEAEHFDALSYVWGDPKVKTGSMICNGFQMDITHNLWAALSQIWSTWPDKRLWVDAVCINQDDIPERNQQVTMMGDIYRTAQCVVVWLGASTTKSDAFFDILDKTSRTLDVSGGEDVNGDSGTRTPLKDQDIGSLSREILSRPWFERAWTLQEIQLARKATICCGPRHAGFDVFLQTVDGYNRQQVAESYCGGDNLHVPIIPPSDEDGTLFYHLAETSTRVASDPRDKLYSLLSLLPKELYEFIEVDYSLSTEETIIWASRICIEIDEETGCLADAGLENQEDRSLPSWAIDWRARHDYDHHYKYKRIGHIKTDSDKLRLRNERGKSMNRVSRELEIPGGGLGRIEIDKVSDRDKSIRLALFPECAIRWLGPPPERVPCWVELSNEKLLGLCSKIKQHDDEKCSCLDGSRRVEYSWRNLPRGVKSGDWLWQRAYEKGDYDFILRPVDVGLEVGAGSGKMKFQLVGEAWGKGIRGPFTRLRVPLRHPEIKAVVGSFVLV